MWDLGDFKKSKIMALEKMVKKLAIIIIPIIFIVALLVVSKGSFYKALNYLHITKACYKSNEVFLEIFEQEDFDYTKMDKAVTNDGLTKLANKDLSPTQLKIPTISHHIYFTSEENPRKLNEYLTGIVESSLLKLNNTEDWQHYIWTNKPDIFADQLVNLKGVKFKDIQEFQGHPLYPYVIQAMDKGATLNAHFAEASDILRFMVVQKFGGMYNDLDYEIYNANSLVELMHKFDFMGGRETTADQIYYGNAFFASKPNHPIVNDIIAREIRNHSQIDPNLPDYVKYPCRAFDKVYFNSPPMFTMAYFSKNNIEGNIDIILPSWMIYNASFARYKNSDCNYSEITKDIFLERENNLDSLIKDYTLKASKEALPGDNIYYSYQEGSKFDIIGADMFCGSWSKGNSDIKKRIYYWIWK
jgi:hypothetical protein